jgi:hypothetical protein
MVERRPCPSDPDDAMRSDTSSATWCSRSTTEGSAGVTTSRFPVCVGGEPVGIRRCPGGRRSSPDDGPRLRRGPATARSSPMGAAAHGSRKRLDARHTRRRRNRAVGLPTGYRPGRAGLELAFNQRLAGHPGGQLVAVPAGGGQAQRWRTLAATIHPGKAVPHDDRPGPAARRGRRARRNLWRGSRCWSADGRVVRARPACVLRPQPPGRPSSSSPQRPRYEAGVVRLSDRFPIEDVGHGGGQGDRQREQRGLRRNVTEAFAESATASSCPWAEGRFEGPRRDGGELRIHLLPVAYEGRAIKATGIPQSTLPAHISSDLDLAVSAIGQGEVLATPLEMASVSQAIADGGVREPDVPRHRPARSRRTRSRFASPRADWRPRSGRS